MKLPNGDRATIDPRKIVDYCLSQDHEDGRHKAHLFKLLLGLTGEDAGRLLAELRQAAEVGEASQGRQDKYGQRYVIDFEMSGPSGGVMIRSAWIIRAHETVPRLVSCYIL